MQTDILFVGQGEATDLEFMFVKGHHIRYIHVPKSVRPSTAIEDRHLQVAAQKRVHALQQGPLMRRPKGDGGAAVDESADSQLEDPCQLASHVSPMDLGC
jgi:hypothetical protein